MIDTVCLTLPFNQLILLDEKNREISQWDLQSKTEFYSKHVRNPTKKNKDSGKYFPRITLYSRRYGQAPSVKIEFSVPKLIFNNNLEELSDGHFDDVIDVLQERLLEMGVRIFKQSVINASVSTVHFSKNLVLENGYTSSYVISELQKIDLRKSFDFARARYINNGQSLCAHTRAHELVVYDKIADLAKKKKRAVDKDQTSTQLSLFDSIKKNDHALEVLRIEIRLCNKRKINSVFKKLKLKEKPSFQDVFNKNVSQAVVNDYWESLITNDQLALFTIEQSSKDMLRELCRGSPDLKPKQAIYQVGLMTLAKDSEGLRELRSILEASTSDRSWYRIKKDFKELSTSVSNAHVRSWVHDLKKQLKTYKPIEINK